jgi:nitrous oxide reductase accessory protein NosL
MTDPTVCHVCQTQRSIGIGIGFTHSRDKDPRWLCAECALIIEDIRRIKRMDAYEHAALDKVDDIAGDYAAEHGTDMAGYDDLTRRMLWKTVVQGYSNALRDAIRNGSPF